MQYLYRPRRERWKMTSFARPLESLKEDFDIENVELREERAIFTIICLPIIICSDLKPQRGHRIRHYFINRFFAAQFVQKKSSRCHTAVLCFMRL